ncbi:MAG: hypothetical protein JXA42_05490, partial [Anaerolineales bacterium]|nr:hypothetical protein [Anaerolineales bacterium]
MKSNDDCEFIHHAQSVSLRNSHLDIKINTTSGCWDSLTFTPLDMQILDVGHASIPVEVGLDQSWLPGDDGWQVKEVNCSRDAEGVHCVLRLCCTNVEVYDSYTLQRNEPILARKAKVIYGGRDEKTFWGVLFRLPAISLGNKEECDVIAPGQSTLSRIPFYRQAAIKAHRPILKDIQHRLGHGRTPVGPLEPCPDITPGIVGIHNRELNFSVISWFYSWEDTAALSTEGFGDSLGITHHHRVEGWADLDREYTCGTQYIVLLRGEIRDALTFIRSTWSKLGVHTPPDKSIHSGDTTIFETSVQMEGGLARFSRKLPHLRDMGINMLYLLPVWLGTKVTDALYAADHALTYRLDPAWQRIRVPHRIISY